LSPNRRKYRDGETKPYPALAVYLAGTHHGKARTVLRSTTGEGDDVFGVRAEPSTLVISSDHWPLDFSIAELRDHVRTLHQPSFTQEERPNVTERR
jgi:hypothetical protein